MQVPVFLIADYAYADSDGKLHVIGAGIDRLFFDSFPAQVRQLCVAVKTDLPGDTDEEHPKGHTVTVALRDEEGHDVVPAADIPLVSGLPGLDRFTFVWSLRDREFASPGRYQASLAIDGETVAEAELTVEATPESPHYPPTQHRRREAFEAAQAGDFERAIQIMTELVGQFPGDPDFQNSLGFLYLFMDRANEALPHLLQAQEHGFPRRDILLTNLGVAQYKEGMYKDALKSFQQAATLPTVQGDALLAQLTEDDINIVYIAVVAQFLALISINAAWAAWGLSDKELAARYLMVVTGLSGEVDLDPLTIRSLEALAQILRAE